ncbi:Chitin-binding domain 3 [Pyrenophora seminiperda CCB06]|uniref:Chitin-binding domain 3 n=1 Tax=Pyrenophora seminiperda CCB06 TaxID=1302712 RepID=A0A3M7MDK5_9PLEO|nr:Chitin-binding domain 3 [Pyrenophora seminiperda CCB06]
MAPSLASTDIYNPFSLVPTTNNLNLTMKSFTVAAAIAGFTSSVAAHGFISSPPPRLPGPGLKAACGDQVFNTQNSDKYGNVQGSIQNLQGSHPDCKIWQCKGVPFSDHGDIVQYKAGQVVDMKVEIHAPHDGLANVSIVSTATDKIIGKPLISWDKYALTSVPMSQHPEWTSFNITMPDVGSECSKAGDCVIQWFWDAPTINQTYESCIDFTMGGGSGSGNGNGTSPATPAQSSNSTVPSPTPTPTPSSAEPAKIRRMIAAERAHPRAFAA